jgi:hypothetical protein
MDFPLQDPGLMAYVEELEAAAKRTTPAGFDSLVESALDFLQQALKQVKTDPKYSVIHFSTGIELILKARLLHEHWSLVVAKPGEVSKQQFVAGKFESVNTKQCYDRLERVCEETLTDERECFSDLASHRNRLVHFFHAAYSANPDARLLESIVIQQLRAGALLMRLLTQRWSAEFENHNDAIRELDRSLQDHRQYLEAKLQLVTPELEKYKAAGGIIWPCTYCLMDAAMVRDYGVPLKTAHCAVCNTSRSYIQVKCPACGKTEVDFDTGSGFCGECEVSFDIDFLLEQFGNGRGLASCPDCEYSDCKSIVTFGEKYLCLSCGALHHQVDSCEYCGELIGGSADGTYLDGCMFCEGRMGVDD